MKMEVAIHQYVVFLMDGCHVIILLWFFFIGWLFGRLIAPASIVYSSLVFPINEGYALEFFGILACRNSHFKPSIFKSIDQSVTTGADPEFNLTLELRQREWDFTADTNDGNLCFHMSIQKPINGFHIRKDSSCWKHMASNVIKKHLCCDFELLLKFIIILN